MSKKKPNSYMDKNTFLKNLTTMDKDQIHNFILKKGKDPKLINPIVYSKPID